MILEKNPFADAGSTLIGSVPDGAEALVLADLIRAAGSKHGDKGLVYVARDGQRLQQIAEALSFFAPELDAVTVPAWDCLPYDRVSPNAVVVARRMQALARLAGGAKTPRPQVLLTTVNALIQRLPSPEAIASECIHAQPGNRIDMAVLTGWLERHGFLRTDTVRDVGEYAVRGGIVDLFAPGTEKPVRLDFFGDTLESIRAFEPESQRSVEQLQRLDLVPMTEVVLSDDTVRAFRQAYVARFGAATREDVLYQAISEGRRYPGFEHWLPLFQPHLETLLDYLPDAPVVLESLADEAFGERSEQIRDHYQARVRAVETTAKGATPYNPVEPEALYLEPDDLNSLLSQRPVARLSPFVSPQSDGPVIDVDGRHGRSFAAERAAGDVNVFDALIAYLGEISRANRRSVIACWSAGSRDRLAQVLDDHGLERCRSMDSWAEALAAKKGITPIVVLGVETGFEIGDTVLIGEQDILGDRLIRRKRSTKKGSDFLTEVTSLAAGDFVVHADHGIGQFAGLKTIEAAGAPHDCLELVYAGGDKLFLPVENIELLSRYGSEEATAQLDRLGGGAWQARKAKLKKRIREIADQLIKTAAARALKTAPVMAPPEGLYDEFAARFPYEETDDQLAAIDRVAEDMAAGRPMDRLICGDVGFGKTEVALRAAFVTALSGRQVAVIVPTTLLVRQHFKTFSDRFAGLPVQIGHASRLVGQKEINRVKAGLKDGTIDIAIGTHALLGKAVEFRDLGLLVIDEEQHFGVRHKERLKELKSDVHVLTLTATPIPRTLQLALTGVRELSLIATPPVDRLAVRTFISPFDGLVVREALLRERYRGGQSFYVCPRVSDLAEVKAYLDESVPEVKVAVAHGQMPPGMLDDIMTAFYEGQYDVLLSTTIVESGLDIPSANTLIVHRADMFGLAQLYQLRGRVGRSKIRAYSLFTVPANRTLTATADRRLKVLQSLDTLGAGFQLASHDLDIRGAGNLLGDEQSGHIREVGFELYQQMLEEAVASLRTGEDEADDTQWSPQISIGTPVLIPEHYVPDLQLRMGLYRRIADLADAGEIDSFGAELIDRFGPLPDEVDHLLKIVFIKSLCRRANVEKIESGPRGAVIGFRNNEFPEPAALVGFIGEQGSLAKLRPDHRVVFSRDWPDAGDRLKGSAVLLTQLVKLAEKKQTRAA